ELRRRNPLRPAVERLGLNRLVLLDDAMDLDLALLLELPHGIAHILHAILVGQHGAPIDALLDPSSGGRGLARGEVRWLPLGPMPGEALAILWSTMGRIVHDVFLPRAGFF